MLDLYFELQVPVSIMVQLSFPRGRGYRWISRKPNILASASPDSANMIAMHVAGSARLMGVSPNAGWMADTLGNSFREGHSLCLFMGTLISCQPWSQEGF
jgi:hypothetical protein